ncbi:Transthyretin/hydroxyisourate hydrolase [Parasponia andersonii]|uniref:Transthyretin/hydroxyisourate hydrolase n=1 Tax=Parasponia andersonii TaxID=3476 RepID=A0A2P5C6K3_PARAD|nr:Transthyretin/hydroxyisourate hydrolase [Parasponia andersonii]
MEFGEEDLLACCGSTRFAHELAKASPFSSLHEAITLARDVWFNKVDVHAWLQAFSAHPQIGHSPPSSSSSSSSSSSAHSTSAQWSKGEQSTALATATSSSLQELSEWNARYKEKFGFVFLICASGRSTDEILSELKKRYPNRPIVEFEIAAEEQMKITELRLAKLFSTKAKVSLKDDQYPESTASKKVEEASAGKTKQNPTRTRPPITTHVLDVSRGSPGASIEVQLEIWKGPQPRPVFGESDRGGWAIQGSSVTDNDGRSGHLMSIVDSVSPGIYRISFNTGKYCPSGFFPYVSIVFEIKESQKREHFHVPLLFSPFSVTTYRGS